MLHNEKKEASLELQAALDYMRRTGNAPPFAERRAG